MESLTHTVAETWPGQDLQVKGHWAKVKGHMRQKVSPCTATSLDDHVHQV